MSSDSDYSIFIPKKVENKFRTLCSLSPDLEWSGVLFYKIEGSFAEKRIKVICEDFLLMDQGTAGATEINFNTPEVAGYMAQNMELLDCYQGLCHSHNVMATFFSGTDTATLKQEGWNMNNFVSLIVNNAGEYTAGITRKVKYAVERQIHTKLTGSYPFFDKGEVSIGEITEDKEDTSVKYDIEWTELRIEKEQGWVDEVVERFKIVTGRRRVYTPTYGGYPAGFSPREIVDRVAGGVGRGIPSYSSPRGSEDEPELFGHQNFVPDEDIRMQGVQKPSTSKDDMPSDTDYEELYHRLKFPEEKIEGLVREIIMGTPFQTKKVALKLIGAGLEEMYSRRFNPKDDDPNGRANMMAFNSWFSSWIEFSLYDFDMDWVFEQLHAHETLYDDELVCILAMKLIDIIGDFPENVFQQEIIEQLKKFLI